MECKFYVGQKVVLASEFEDLIPAGVRLPEVGIAYTIREIVPLSGGVGLRFVEIKNGKRVFYRDGLAEPAFWYAKFRPAVETETDISALKQIVEDVKNGKIKEYAE